LRNRKKSALGQRLKIAGARRASLERVRNRLAPEWRDKLDQFLNDLEKYGAYAWQRLLDGPQAKPLLPKKTPGPGLRLVVNNKPQALAPKTTSRWRPDRQGDDDGPRAA
jgi:hypothetical protein